MGVSDGVDDQLVELEVAREAAETEGYFFGGADDVAGPFAFFGGIVAAGGEGDEWVRRGGDCGEFAESFVGSGYRAAVIHADAALEEADACVEVVGFFLRGGADDADGQGGFGFCAVR